MKCRHWETCRPREKAGLMGCMGRQCDDGISSVQSTSLLDASVYQACPCNQCPYDWGSDGVKTTCPHRLKRDAGCMGRVAWEQLCAWAREFHRVQSNSTIHAVVRDK